VCGEPEFEDAEVDTLLNPKVLVEVLSPSITDYDRGGKYTHYRLPAAAARDLSQSAFPGRKRDKSSSVAERRGACICLCLRCRTEDLESQSVEDLTQLVESLQSRLRDRGASQIASGNANYPLPAPPAAHGGRG
jgi:hypothetical protein